MSQLALKKSEYNQIRAQATDTRKRESLNSQVISNSDDIVLQAMRYIISNDPNLLYAALVVCTGLRPIEIAKVAQFSTKLNNQQNNPEFWACQQKFAKRGTMKTKYNQCRDRCFLCPYWLIERGLNIIIVRKRWPCKHLTKYSTHWQQILEKAYPQLPGCNARLFRRFFAAYAYHYFAKSFFVSGVSQSSVVGFASWMLGHANLEEQVSPIHRLCYSRSQNSICLNKGVN